MFPLILVHLRLCASIMRGRKSYCGAGVSLTFHVVIWWFTIFFCGEKQDAITDVVRSRFNDVLHFCAEDWRHPHLDQNNWASISYIEQKPFVSDSVNFALGLFPITFVSNKMCQVFKEWLYFKPSWKTMKFLASGLWTINNIFLCFA